jgi:hypothetical protein
MVEDRESFLHRWSRRKVEAGSRDRPPAGDQAPAASEPTQREPAEPGPAVDLEDLPDIETLHAGSDFKAFLREGVPQELRMLALRKLWRLNPTLANLDGLVEYGEDYAAGNLAGALKSAYRVGRGFARHEDQQADRSDEQSPQEQPAERRVAGEASTPSAEQTIAPAAPSSGQSGEPTGPTSVDHETAERAADQPTTSGKRRAT